MTDSFLKEPSACLAAAFIAGVFGMMFSVTTGNDPHSGFSYGATIGLLIFILSGVISDV
jgi:Mg2+ and Co2+ transporter CorA